MEEYEADAPPERIAEAHEWIAGMDPKVAAVNKRILDEIERIKIRDAAQRWVRAEEAETAADERPYAQRGADISLSTEVPWLVEERMAQIGVCQWVADKYVGKTVLAVGLALSIANKKQWWMGHEIQRHGVIIYFAAEGGAPFEIQIDAWLKANPECTLADVIIVNEQYIDWNDPGSVEKFETNVDALLGEGDELVAVFMDTQIDVMGDIDENGVEVGRTLALIRRWAVIRKCMVTLLHHKGYSERRGGRGHSSQGGKLDTEAFIDLNGEKTRQIEWIKVKGAAQPDERDKFTIEPVTGSRGAVAKRFIPDPSSVATATDALGVLTRIKQQIVDLLWDTDEFYSKTDIGKKVIDSDGRALTNKVTGPLVEELAGEGLISTVPGRRVGIDLKYGPKPGTVKPILGSVTP